jgi:hypothetical protein
MKEKRLRLRTPNVSCLAQSDMQVHFLWLRTIVPLSESPCFM